ncbi:uncharacterized protein [Dendropsophus ebraccatus]|uniref:uncharacterized protein n=1 Tax=Dendropsophus ebraccatus TaxID=150705 RepID=UPI003831BA52
MEHRTQVSLGPVEDDETTDYRNTAEEHDDPTFPSIGPLISHESSFTSISLQISCSIPPSAAEFRWSADVLFAFDHLPALTIQEAETLNSFLGLPSTSNQPVSVKDFLAALETHPDKYTHLRKLAQQLKSLGRADIVIAMHKEKAALRWLGPVLPEEHLIRDIVPSLWTPLTVKLSLSHPTGYDWKWLAEQLSIPRHFIDLWEQQGGIPADKVLKAWQVRTSEATVGRLFDLLIERREDLAALL